MRNILILLILALGLIFTSFIKNKTRLLEKQLSNLNKDINILNSDLIEANLEFAFITSPKNISLLAKEFLDEDFSYYKKTQIKNIYEQKKYFSISNKTKKIDLNITKKNTYPDTVAYTELSKTINKVDSNRIKKWAGIQVLKIVLGLPPTPTK